MLTIIDTSASVKRSSHSKRNAEGLLSLQKKQRSSSSSISSELAELSWMRKEQLAEDKHYKIMQLSVEDHKYKAESERQ